MFILAIFIFQKTCQSITRVGWKNWTTPLSLFREGIAVYHHPRPEWYHISCRLLCNTWQISNLSWFSSELMCSTFQRLLPLPVYPSTSLRLWNMQNLFFLCVFLVILYWDRTNSSRGLGCTADGKTVKTAESRISTSFQRGIVLTCFAPALHWGGNFPLSLSIGGYFEADITRSDNEGSQGQAWSSGPSYGLYSSWGPSLKSTHK